MQQESDVALIEACEKVDKDKIKHLVIWNNANPNVWSQVCELHYLVDNSLHMIIIITGCLLLLYINSCLDMIGPSTAYSHCH